MFVYRHQYFLAVFVLPFALQLLAANPSSEQIKAALDDVTEYVLEIDAPSENSLSIVEDAEGGSVLKISLEPNQQVTLSFKDVPNPGQVDFLYQYSAGSAAGIMAAGGLFPLDEEGAGSGFWAEGSQELPYNSSMPFSSVEFQFPADPFGEPIEFLLDEVLIERGMREGVVPDLDETQIRTALDDVTDYVLEIEVPSENSLSLVEDAEATGGSALKISLEPYQQVTLSFRDVPNPGQLDFRYQYSVVSAAGFMAGGGLFPLDEEGAGVWREASRELYYNRSIPLSSVEFEFPSYPIGEPIEFLLDEVLIDKGIRVSILPGVGGTGSLTPEGPFFAYGQMVLLEAEAEAGYEFHQWNWVDNWGSSGQFSSNPLAYTLGRNIEVEPSFYRVIAGEAADVLVPQNSMSYEQLSKAGEALSLKLVRPDYSSDRLVFRAEGAGYVRMDLQPSEASDEDYYFIDGETYRGEASSFSFWKDSSRATVEVDFRGAAILNNLRFEEGNRVLLQTVGEGSVSGMPASGLALPEQRITLTASPEDGWRFGGWSGFVNTASHQISFFAVEPVELSAHYYREESVAGVETRIFSETQWELENLEILGNFPLKSGEEAVIEWVVEGPAGFSFDFEKANAYGDLTVQIDNEPAEWVRANWIDGGTGDRSDDSFEGNYEAELGAGVHIVRAKATDDSSTLDVGYRISNLKVEHGWPVRVEAQRGGTVEGAESGLVRVLPDQMLSLTAEPDAGYEFTGWGGHSSSQEASLARVIDGPTHFYAHFQTIDFDHPLFEHQSGDALWIPQPDGSILSPLTLEGDEYASLHTTMVGPARLSYTATDSIALEYRLDGGPRERLWGDYLDIPAGEHSVEISVSHSTLGWYNQAQLTFTKLLKIDLGLTRGFFSSSPSLRSNGKGRRVGYFVPGTVFTFEAETQSIFTPAEWNVFSGWSGDFTGLDQADSFTLTKPMIAEASFSVSIYRIQGRMWEVSSLGALGINRDYVLYLPSDGEAVTLRSSLQGPGVLWVQGWDLTSISARLNGISLEEAWEGAFLVPDESGVLDLSVSGSFGRVRFIDYQPGFYLQGGDWAEGSVQIENGMTNQRESSGIYPAGARLRVIATPELGNQFSRWISPDEFGAASEVDLVATEHLLMEPYFEAGEDVGGLEWDYSGVRPVFLADSGLYPEGSFEFEFPPTGDPQTALASTIVQGPKLMKVSVHRPSRDYNGVVYRVLLDGESYLVEGASIDLDIPEGRHELTLKLEVPPSYTESTFASIGFPEFTSAFAVDFLADSATLDISLDKDTYQHSEIVRVTAPALNSEGKPFRGWKQSGQEGFISQEETLELTLTREGSFRAIYDDFPIRVENAYLSSEEVWEFDGETLTPGKQTAIEANGNSIVGIEVHQASRVFFSIKTTGGSLELSNSSGSKLYESLGGRDWTTYCLFVEEGDVASMGFSSLSNDDRYWLGDFELKPGWGPHIFPEGPGTLSFEPSLENAQMSELITVRATPLGNERFLGWDREDGTTERGVEQSFEYGKNVVLNPVFGFETETSAGSIWQNRLASWTLSDLDTLSLEASASSKLPRLQLDVTGPATFSFNGFTDSIEAEIDHVPAIISRENRWPVEYWISIPDGEHVLSLADNRPSLRLLDVRITNEVIYDLPDTLRLSPRKTAYEPREEIVVSISGGSGFEGWEAPYEGNDVSFSILAGVDPLPMPIYSKGGQFTFGGIDWTVKDSGYIKREGVNEQGDFISSLVSFDSISEGSLSAFIEGPVLFRWARGRVDADFLLDGIPLSGFAIIPYDEGDNSQLFPIPDGRHHLKISNASIHGNYLYPGTGLVEGYLLRARASGSDLEISPLREYYTMGEVVTLSSGIDSDRVEYEWKGLPESAIVEKGVATFEIRENLDVELFVWRDIELLGLNVQHASNAQWTYDPYYGYELSELSAPNKDLIRFDASGPGLLRYEYSSSGYSGLNLSSQLNEGRRHSHGFEEEASLRAIKGGDKLIVALSLTDGVYSPPSDSIILDRLTFEPVEQKSPYLNWWDGFATTDSNRAYWDSPELDLDEDGLNSYAEFLLGTDPWRANRMLSVSRTNSVSVPFEVGVIRFAEELGIEAKVEFSKSLEGPWLDASEWFLDKPGEGATLRSYLIEAPFLEGETGPIFFRSRVDLNIEIPDLDELFEEYYIAP